MKLQTKLFLIVAFLISLPAISFAEDRYSDCVTGSGTMDCISYTVVNDPVFNISADRKEIYVGFGTDDPLLIDYGKVFNYAGDVVVMDGGGDCSSSIALCWSTEDDDFEDGQYWIYIWPADGVAPSYSFQYVLVHDGKWYLNVNDIPTQSESYLGSLNFGIAIIVTLFSLFMIAYIWNQFKPKKPWR